MNIGKAIQETRSRRGLSQRELARRIRVTASYLCSVERGRRFPGMLLVKKVSKALRVKIDKLFALALRRK